MAIETDLTDAGSSITIDGVVFLDSANVGSGTGGYNTFLAVGSNDGTEAGFNSDDTPPLDTTTDGQSTDNIEIDHAKTHTVLLGDIPIITVNGAQYYEFRVDLNEANSDPSGQISLDQFILRSSSSATIDTKAEFDAANLVYNLDAGGDRTLLLSEVSTGSGTDDYAVLVPVEKFAGADPSTTYLYLYVEMGAKGGDWAAQSGFEEWNVQNAGRLSGVKFNDLDGDGVRDANEAGVAGVTIFIDADKDGVLDQGERSTTTDANGNYTFYGIAGGTYQIDEVTPAGSQQTTGAYETVVVPTKGLTPGQIIVVDPIGNFYPLPSMSIDKVAVDGQVADQAGEKLNYTIAVKNTGNVALTNVVVTDPNADANSITLVSGDVNSNGKLDVGETWNYTAYHTLTQAEIDSNGGGDGDIDNTATADSAQTDPVSDSATIPVAQKPSMSIDKVAVEGQVADVAGEKLNYTIAVKNTGNVTLTNIVVTDPNADANSIILVSGDTNTNGKLDVGETWNYTAYHTLTQAEIDSNGGGDGDIDNTATADSAQTDPVSDSATIPVEQRPSMSIDKRAVSGQVADQAGEKLNYTIAVSNTGNVTLTNIQVTDNNADAGSVKYVSGDTNSNGDLDVGEIWNYTAYHTLTQAEIDSNGGGDGDIDNTATADSAETNPVSDDEAIPVARNPAMSIDKVADDGQVADQAGEKLYYTIAVSNTGNVTLTNVDVTDPNADAGSITYISGDTNNNAKLDVGETWSYTAYHTLTQAEIDSNGGGDGDIDNTATADSAQTDPVSDSATIPVAQRPSMSIDKVADDGQVADQAGEKLYYTITVKNTGNVTLTSVAVTDPNADANSITLVSGDANNNAKLDVGETWSYTAYHTLTQAEIDSNGGGDGDIDNTATADSAQTDPVSDDATIPVARHPGVDIEKLVSVDGPGGTFYDADTPQGPGATSSDDIVFKFVVQNTGNTTLTGVVVSDDLFDLDGKTLTVNGQSVTDAVLNDGGFTLGTVAVGETDTLIFDPNTFTAGQHVNTATVTTAQGVTDTDKAYYYGMVEGPGVRTPGFWMNLGYNAKFWDGIIGNEKKSGDTFADGELLAYNDLNGSAAGNGGNTSPYILLGDMNGNGTADAGETTLRISLANALKMLDADEDGGGKAFDVARQVISAQLNYEAGNNIGDGSAGTPKFFIKEGVEWMLEYLDTSDDGVLTLAEGRAAKIAASSNAFSLPTLSVPGDDDYKYDNSPGDGGTAFEYSNGKIVSGSKILTALDEYNNDGTIYGVAYANDADWNVI